MDRGPRGRISSCRAAQVTVRAAFPVMDLDCAAWLLARAGDDDLRVLLGSSRRNGPARKLLREAGAEVRVLSGLHAKLLLVGEITAVELSAKLTRTGINREPEATRRLEPPGAARDFDALWAQASE